MTLWNQEQRAVFHLKKGLWFERLDDDSVRMFMSTPLAAYWTHEKGFHDPETEIAVIERGSWESIIAYLEITPTPAEPDVLRELLKEAREALRDSQFHLRIDMGARNYHGKAEALIPKIDEALAATEPKEVK